MLPLLATQCGAFACLTEIYDRVLWRCSSRDLNAIVLVLDDLNCHGCLADELIIEHPERVSGCRGSLRQVDQQGSPQVLVLPYLQTGAYYRQTSYHYGRYMNILHHQRKTLPYLYQDVVHYLQEIHHA